MFTRNENHMMYGSWDIERNKQIFLSFWTIFHPLTPLTTPKIEILKKMKKSTWRYYHFTHVYRKWKSYDVWFLRYGAWQIFLSFWTIFCPFTPLKTQKIKILKKWKNPWRCYHFTQVYQKSWSYAILFLTYGVWQM